MVGRDALLRVRRCAARSRLRQAGVRTCRFRSRCRDAQAPTRLKRSSALRMVSRSAMHSRSTLARQSPPRRSRTCWSTIRRASRCRSSSGSGSPPRRRTSHHPCPTVRRSWSDARRSRATSSTACSCPPRAGSATFSCSSRTKPRSNPSGSACRRTVCGRRSRALRTGRSGSRSRRTTCATGAASPRSFRPISRTCPKRRRTTVRTPGPASATRACGGVGCAAPWRV